MIRTRIIENKNKRQVQVKFHGTGPDLIEEARGVLEQLNSAFIANYKEDENSLQAQRELLGMLNVVMRKFLGQYRKMEADREGTPLEPKQADISQIEEAMARAAAQAGEKELDAAKQRQTMEQQQGDVCQIEEAMARDAAAAMEDEKAADGADAESGDAKPFTDGNPDGYDPDK